MTISTDELRTGQYYLHENGSLIYKPHGGVQADSAFVRKVWPVSQISATPHDFVSFLCVARGLGANEGDIYRLANHNMISDFISDWERKVFPGEVQ